MEAPRRRRLFWLVLAASALAVWIGYLAWLVARHDRPVIHFGPFRVEKTPEVVLSRSQLLAAQLVVSAELATLNGPAEHCEVVWHEPGIDAGNVGESLRITNLAASLDVNGKPPAVPGRYLLPLTREGDTYQIVPIPPTPGYPAVAPGRSGPGRIYPDNPDTREQLRAILH
jgi:hypothetical protein